MGGFGGPPGFGLGPYGGPLVILTSPAAPKDIVLPDPTVILNTQSILTVKNLVSLQMNFTLTGGSFTATILQGSIANLLENLSFSLPSGRVVTLKQTGSSLGRGGLVQTVGGPCTSPAATLTGFVGLPGGVNAFCAGLASQLASQQGAILLYWETINPPISGFVFRGNILSGIQQLASIVLGDVIVRNDGIYVVDPGVSPASANTFKVPVTDIVSISQLQDYSMDVVSVLNPVLTAVNFNNPGDFVYDSAHAQKQPKFTVQAGAPGSQGSTDFIPIPDGWLVDGNYEEWTPPSGTDFTNPTPSVTNGRYWKVFQSPSNPANLRGITNFTRLVKSLNLPGNVSPFVGSPVTGITRQNTTKEFIFDNAGTQSGIYGFTADSTTLFDSISGQFFDLPSCLVLRPNGLASSGEAASNFFSITMEMWTFPRVLPTTFPVGDPVNPFGIPNNAVVINPSSQVNYGSGTAQMNYYLKYASNYKRINSPHYRTTTSCLYRGTMPQPGDQLLITGQGGASPKGVDQPACGRIQSVGLTLSRSAVLLNITAEIYDYSPDGNLSSASSGGTII